MPNTPNQFRFVRILRARPRLFVAALIGLIVIAALPASWPMATRLVAGWDIGVALYLAAAFEIVSRCTVEHIKRRAAIEDEGQTVILLLTVAAAVASLAAIVVLLGGGNGAGRSASQLALAAATIVLSWTFIHTIFAFHYAHEYYAEGTAAAPALNFPGTEKPDYLDFAYFSFVIGMTSQVSDVTVATTAIRRTVLAHGVVAFLFNVALLALMVNIAASAI